MTKKTIIIDPKAKFEDMEHHTRSTPRDLQEFNRSQPECEPLTEQDEEDLEEMFLEVGILKEVSIN